jgi:microcin C transport system substrate-binding protein
MVFSRLSLAAALTALLLGPALAQTNASEPASAQETKSDGEASSGQTKHHALSLVGEPKYPPDFTHFDFVNPDAPKGGLVRLPSIGGFDSLNPVLYRGEQAPGIGFVNESLMSDSIDEPSTAYGLIAESASYPDDYSSVTFKLRDEARWHDGEPITPEDVIYSLKVNKEANPRMGLYYKNVTRAEKTGDNEVTFYFDTKGNRELPMIMGQLTILPKHFWTGTNADGEKRDPMKTTMEPPLGSGPYRVKSVSPGRSISFERVEDYWGKDLPVNKGMWNFDEIRFDSYRDITVAFESFKAGNLDYWNETSSKNWAMAYDFPAIENGEIVRQEVRLERGMPMQAFVLNQRRPKFQDRRVRQALNLAFDFEWTNKNLFFGQYERVESYFQNSELAAPKALPEGRELEILETVRDQVPEEVFTTVHQNPTNNDQTEMRGNLRKAVKLLREAGWQVKDGALTNTETGEQMNIEFLIVSPLFERIIQPYLRNLNRLGITGSIRLVDSAQYTRRLNNFDYDVVVGNFGQSESPGNEQRDYWGSEAADREGSMNLIGIKDPAIDKLIDYIIFAKDREELVAATHALDRVLLWHDFVVPQWFSPSQRIAYRSHYGKPEKLPGLTPGFVQVWWDEQDEAATDPQASN